MLVNLSVMVGVYILIRFLYIIQDDELNLWIKILCVPSIIVTIICLVDIVTSSSEVMTRM